jgi:hypothetical protein
MLHNEILVYMLSFICVCMCMHMCMLCAYAYACVQHLCMHMYASETKKIHAHTWLTCTLHIASSFGVICTKEARQETMKRRSKASWCASGRSLHTDVSFPSMNQLCSYMNMYVCTCTHAYILKYFYIYIHTHTFRCMYTWCRASACINNEQQLLFVQSNENTHTCMHKCTHKQNQSKGPIFFSDVECKVLFKHTCINIATHIHTQAYAKQYAYCISCRFFCRKTLHAFCSITKCSLSRCSVTK